MKRGLQGCAIVLMSLGTVSLSQTPAHSPSTPHAISYGVASSVPTTAPEKVGLSSQRLDRIGEAIQRSVDDGRIAGGLSLVARHGKVAYLQAVGMADREAHKPLRTDNLFRLCSMSKVITAVAVMMLYEDGRFELSDPVSNFLPEFKHMKVLDPPVPQDHTSPPGALVDAKRPITIMHLLNHTAGLTYPWDNRLGKVYVDAHVGTGLRQQDSTLATSIQRLATLPLLFQPGDYSEYSLSFDVLGRLVEVVSGMPYDKFLEERLFKPLGMKDTYFFLPKDKAARLAGAYGYNEHQGLYPILDGKTQAVPTEMGNMFEYTADYPYRGPRTYFSGGAGLNGTIEDYYRFCQMILNGGELNGVRILSPKTVEFMTHNHSPAIPGILRWGFGVIVHDDPQEMTELGSLNSFGGGGYYYTSFLIDPHEDLIAIFMSQLSPDGNLNLNNKVLRLAYQAIVD